MKKILVFIICAVALLSLASCGSGGLAGLDPEYKLMENKSLGTVYKYAGSDLDSDEQAELIVHSGKAVMIYTYADRSDEAEDGYYLKDTRISYYTVTKNDDGTLTLKMTKVKTRTDAVGDYPEEYKKQSGYGVWTEHVVEDEDADEYTNVIYLNESDKTFTFSVVK